MNAWPDMLIKLGLLIGGSLIAASGYAQEPDLQQTLGAAVNILTQHTHAETADLKLVSVSESRRHALKTTHRIAGYPITGKLARLDKTISQQLAALLLEKDNYADVRQRCRNQSFHGIRFNKEHEIVEVAIGVPCNQVLVVFRDGKETKWWGGVLGDSSAKQVLKALGE